MAEIRHVAGFNALRGCRDMVASLTVKKRFSSGMKQCRMKRTGEDNLQVSGTK